VRASDIQHTFPENIKEGNLHVSWFGSTASGTQCHLTLAMRAKPAVLWKLYEAVSIAQDIVPDEGSRPKIVKPANVRPPGWNFNERNARAKQLNGVMRSPQSDAAIFGGGRKPTNGEKMMAAARAKKQPSQALQARQLDAMKRPQGERIPEYKSRHQHGGDDDDENRQPNRHRSSGASNTGRRQLSGNPLHGRSQMGIQASFQRSGASAYVGGYRQDGLTNLGNTCYMSAILQALLRLPSFVHDLRACTERLRAGGEKLPQGTSLFAELLDVVKGLHGEQGVFNPKRLKDCISRRSPQFAGNAQQDAHEFLTDILDFMQAELRQHRRKTSAASAHTAPVAEADAPPICPTALNFRCVIEHRHVCCECNAESKRRELYHDLSLDLPRTEELRASGNDGAIPIQQLFDLYFEEEQIEKKCERCGADTAVVHKSLVTLPRVLVLHLKRFDTKLAPAKTLEDGTEVEPPRWVAIKRADLVKLDHSIDVRGHCADDARVALPSSHTSRDLTRARAVPTAPHSAVKPRKQPLGTSSSTANSASVAHRDRDRGSSSSSSLSGGQGSQGQGGGQSGYQRRKAQEEDDIAKAIAASLNDTTSSSDPPPAAAAAAGAEAGAIDAAGGGQSEDAIDVDDEHDQYERAIEESLAMSSAAAGGDDASGAAAEPAPKRTRSDSPPESSAAAAAAPAALPFKTEKPEPSETPEVESWLGTLSTTSTGAGATAAAVAAAAAAPAGSRQNEQTRYELHGVVSHFGSHADVGHYTTTIKLAPPPPPPKKSAAGAAAAAGSTVSAEQPYGAGKWREYNDSTSNDNTVERMIDSERKQKHAYLAVYVLSNSLQPVDDDATRARRQSKRKSSGASSGSRGGGRSGTGDTTSSSSSSAAASSGSRRGSSRDSFDLTGNSSGEEEMKGEDVDDPIEGGDEEDEEDEDAIFKDKPLQQLQQSPPQRRLRPPGGKQNLESILNAAQHTDRADQNRYEDDIQRAMRLSMSDQ
jgi:ubiquitin C-terminal hydrolase